MRGCPETGTCSLVTSPASIMAGRGWTGLSRWSHHYHIATQALAGVASKTVVQRPTRFLVTDYATVPGQGKPDHYATVPGFTIHST